MDNALCLFLIRFLQVLHLLAVCSPPSQTQLLTVKIEKEMHHQSDLGTWSFTEIPVTQAKYMLLYLYLIIRFHI